MSRYHVLLAVAASWAFPPVPAGRGRVRRCRGHVRGRGGGGRAAAVLFALRVRGLSGSARGGGGAWTSSRTGSSSACARTDAGTGSSRAPHPSSRVRDSLSSPRSSPPTPRTPASSWRTGSTSWTTPGASSSERGSCVSAARRARSSSARIRRRTCHARREGEGSVVAAGRCFPDAALRTDLRLKRTKRCASTSEPARTRAQYMPVASGRHGRRSRPRSPRACRRPDAVHHRSDHASGHVEHLHEYAPLRGIDQESRQSPRWDSGAGARGAGAPPARSGRRRRNRRPCADTNP